MLCRDMTSTVFGKNLKMRRESAGVSGNELARRTGIDQANISRMENDKRKPSENEIRLIDEKGGIGVTLEELQAWANADRVPDRTRVLMAMELAESFLRAQVDSLYMLDKAIADLRQRGAPKAVLAPLLALREESGKKMDEAYKNVKKFEDIARPTNAEQAVIEKRLSEITGTVTKEDIEAFRNKGK